MVEELKPPGDACFGVFVRDFVRVRLADQLSGAGNNVKWAIGGALGLNKLFDCDNIFGLEYGSCADRYNSVVARCSAERPLIGPHPRYPDRDVGLDGGRK